MKNLSAIIEGYRHHLPGDSLTAQAIDRGAVLEEISQLATMERVHQLAAILFEAEQEEGRTPKPKEVDLETRINHQVKELRAGLPDTSRTARAIDRNATWEEISECASEEGMGSMAAMMFEAEQEKTREASA